MITTFLQVQTYQWGSHQLQLCVPDPYYVQRLYRGQKERYPQTPFPYWTQVWPSALAMAEFLVKYPSYVNNKQVLELAAGLGLPSLLAAKWANSVVCSDYLPDAVEVMKQSIAKNTLSNVTCKVLDWNALPKDLVADVVLLSDINYDPSQFDVLFTILTTFLNNGTIVLLSTPQRLMAKPFIERLLSLCESHEEVNIEHHGLQVVISVLILKGNIQNKSV